ncbi:MAG TPA: sigma-E factor negative regulatory protein [Rhodanobacteraceae bacterium]|nr:sigma-E factor negative regulatory protein [Rhodanobacteraceae bacterium]
MDPTSREDLSALMDGELAAEPTRFLLRRLEHDPELSATWSRWHLIRACLALEPARMSAPRADSDFAARIGVAIRASAPRERRRHWAQYVGGGAIAAGVAVAALMLNIPGPRTGVPAPVAEVQPAPTSATVAASLADTSTPFGAPVAPGLLSRQPTVFGAQPASANVVYGTGLMQPEYLQRATYARNAMPPYASFQSDQSASPFSIVLLPEQPSADTSAPRH